MDQANTLRQMLGRPGPVIQPLLGAKDSPYLPIVARYLLEQQAKLGEHAVLVDGMEHGLAEALGLRYRHDIWKSLRGHAHLQTLGHAMGPKQCVFRAYACIQKLMHSQKKTESMRQALQRLGWADAYWCLTLPCQAAALAVQLGQGQECLWVVQPTVQSVTEVFQGIRQVHNQAAHIQHALILAGVKSTEEAQNLYQAMGAHISPWLGQELRYFGFIPCSTHQAPLVDKQVQSLQTKPEHPEPVVLHHALSDLTS